MLRWFRGHSTSISPISWQPDQLSSWIQICESDFGQKQPGLAARNGIRSYLLPALNEFWEKNVAEAAVLEIELLRLLLTGALKQLGGVLEFGEARSIVDNLLEEIQEEVPYDLRERLQPKAALVEALRIQGPGQEPSAAAVLSSGHYLKLKAKGAMDGWFIVAMAAWEVGERIGTLISQD